MTPLIAIPTSNRTMATKRKGEKMKMELLQETRIEIIIMMTRRVEMKIPQMLIDTHYPETALVNKTLQSQ